MHVHMSDQGSILHIRLGATEILLPLYFHLYILIQQIIWTALSFSFATVVSSSLDQRHNSVCQTNATHLLF